VATTGAIIFLLERLAGALQFKIKAPRKQGLIRGQQLLGVRRVRREQGLTDVALLGAGKRDQSRG